MGKENWGGTLDLPVVGEVQDTDRQGANRDIENTAKPLVFKNQIATKADKSDGN